MCVRAHTHSHTHTRPAAVPVILRLPELVARVVAPPLAARRHLVHGRPAAPMALSSSMTTSGRCTQDQRGSRVRRDPGGGNVTPSPRGTSRARVLMGSASIVRPSASWQLPVPRAGSGAQGRCSWLPIPSLRHAQQAAPWPAVTPAFAPGLGLTGVCEAGAAGGGNTRGGYGRLHSHLH